MSDNFQKLIEAARLLGLTAEKTPGGRYNFLRAGQRVHTSPNLGKAVEYLVALQAARQAQKPKAAKPTTTREPVAAQAAAAFRGMKNGKERALLLRKLVCDHGRIQVMAVLGISAPTLDEQVRSIRLYEDSATLRQLVDAGRLSWSQLVGKISIRMKLGIEGQEQLALELAKPAPAAAA
jgi:hypothetical protein